MGIRITIEINDCVTCRQTPKVIMMAMDGGSYRCHTRIECDNCKEFHETWFEDIYTGLSTCVDHWNLKNPVDNTRS